MGGVISRDYIAEIGLICRAEKTDEILQRISPESGTELLGRLGRFETKVNSCWSASGERRNDPSAPTYS